jgi:hypothetical protein
MSAVITSFPIPLSERVRITPSLQFNGYLKVTDYGLECGKPKKAKAISGSSFYGSILAR